MRLRYTDLRQLFRLIRRRPAFYSMIVFIRAIGVGANTAIFSFVEALLLQPLPYRDAQELVILRTVKGGEQGMFSYPEYFDLRDRFQGFEDLAAYNPGAAYNVYGGGQAPEELTATLCTHNLFGLLGVDMALGRAWSEAYDRRRAFGLLLNHDLWERRF